MDATPVRAAAGAMAPDAHGEEVPAPFAASTQAAGDERNRTLESIMTAASPTQPRSALPMSAIPETWNQPPGMAESEAALHASLPVTPPTHARADSAEDAQQRVDEETRALPSVLQQAMHKLRSL